jgi:ubiquinone/menaquinone biosynthesis C-methylase UbiE
MKLNWMEKLVVNSPFRAFHLKYLSLPYLLQGINLPSKPNCLEIGCGIGNCAEKVHRQFNCQRFVALDYDPEQIHTARQRFKHLSGLNFIIGSTDTLPAKDCSCDAVFNMGILHHVEEWREAIKEVYRVLKPGGIFLFEDIFRPLVDSFLFRIQYAHPEKGKFNDHEFVGTLEQTGFTLTKRFQIAKHYIIGVAQK